MHVQFSLKCSNAAVSVLVRSGFTAKLPGDVAQDSAEVFQSGFTGQAGEGFLHAVHEVLYGPAVAKYLFHFLQIVNLELYGIGFCCPAVTAYEQFGA